MERDSFVFYRSFAEALKDLDETTRVHCYDAIADYALNGNEPELLGIESAVFKLIKPQIDANNRRFENGLKGGRPKNQNKTKLKPKQNQTETKPKPNVNVNVNVNDNENVNVNDNGNDNENVKGIYQQVADMFNDTCVSFPKVTSISEARKKAIKARLNKYSLADLQEAFNLAEESDFLKGSNNRNWSANFDWLLKDANIAKVLDGNYKNRAKASGGTVDDWFRENGINI